MANAAVNPSSHDQYFTTLKAKYLTGLVSTSTGTVQSNTSYNNYSGAFKIRGRIECDRKLEMTDSDGDVYYIPLFLH